MDVDNGEYLEIELRPPAQIARRILVLRAVVERVMIEHAFREEKSGGQDGDESLFDLRASLVESGAEQELTTAESALVAASGGQIDENALYDAAWEIEALSAILAASGLLEAPPPPPELADFKLTNAVLADREPSAAKLASELNLPDDETAAHIREAAELWLWRASAERAIRDATGQEKDSFRAEVMEVAAEAQNAGLMTTTWTGDFDTGGRAIVDWPDEELATFELASEARLRALNWLCGFGQTWDDTPIQV